MNQNSHDRTRLKKRAKLWRAEAEVATLEDMRVFCLIQAEECEQLLLSAPLLQETEAG